MNPDTSLADSRQDGVRYGVALAILVALTWSDSGTASDGTSPCGKVDNKQLLFSNPSCTVPLETRYGDETDEIDQGNFDAKLKNPYQIYSCADVHKVVVTEKKRKSRIQSDLEAVIDSMTAGVKPLGFDSSPNCKALAQQLQYELGTLEVKALNAAGETLQSKSVISGLAEHWFLGLDLPVTDQKTLKYDSATGTLQPREKDVQLYLSLNYLFGDVLADVKERDPEVKGWQNFSFKIFLRASSKPLDSAGVGVGYRIPRLMIKKLNFDVSGVNLFIGHFWTKEDAIEGGVAKLDSERDAQWRVGVTFDIGSMIKAVKW